MAPPPAPIDQGDAADWIAGQLSQPPSAGTRVIFHTVAWQYFPEAAQDKARAALEAAGAQATPEHPLVWFGMEADGSDAPGAALRLRAWPGQIDTSVGRACFHGRWVDWTPPSAT